MHLRIKSCATAAPDIKSSESVVDIAALAMPVRANAAKSGGKIAVRSAGNA